MSVPAGDKGGFPEFLLGEGCSKAGIPITPGRTGGISPGRGDKNRIVLGEGTQCTGMKGGNVPHT